MQFIQKDFELKVVVFLCLLFLLACGADTRNKVETGHTRVFIQTENIRCEPLGYSIEYTANTLINAGIDVLESQCGREFGMWLFNLCDNGEEPAINLHTIPEESIEDAQNLGFSDTSDLRREDSPGFSFSDCP